MHGQEIAYSVDSFAAAGSALVSAVMPVYQPLTYVREAIASVLSQTFKPYEVIVVNDGSPQTEALERLLVPYSKSIRYIAQTNMGPSSARNAGIRAAGGQYIAFLDSDDWWFPNHLENQIATLQRNPGCEFVYSNYVLVKEELLYGTLFDYFPQAPHATFENLIRQQCRIGTSSVVASRQAIIEAGLFDERLRRSEDFHLWLKMARRGVVMACSPEAQLCHRMDNGLSEDVELMRQSQIKVFEAIIALGVSPEQTSLLRQQSVAIEAEGQLDLAKKSILAKQYCEAIVATERARKWFRNWKLRLVLLGLRSFPFLLRLFYGTYVRLLKWFEIKVRRRRTNRNLALQMVHARASASLTSLAEDVHHSNK